MTMSHVTFFLPAEIIEMGLVAAADPAFAERLLLALGQLPDAAPANASANDEREPAALVV
jgi:hypothetical protein